MDEVYDLINIAIEVARNTRPSAITSPRLAPEIKAAYAAVNTLEGPIPDSLCDHEEELRMIVRTKKAQACKTAERRWARNRSKR